jgi:hypothetical protein
MSFLRFNRFRTGLFLAAILCVAGGLPGIVAAAQGVQLQASLCTPMGPEPAKTTGPTADLYNHCQICPLAGNQPGDSQNAAWEQLQPYPVSLEVVSDSDGQSVSARAELTPQNGRAPPFFSI